MTDVSPIEISITRTRADYFWGVMIDCLQNRVIWLAFVVFPVGQGAMEYDRAVRNLDASPIAHALLGAFTGVLIAAVVLLLIVLITAWVAWKTPGYLSPISYTLSSAGVVGRTENATTDTQWIMYSRAVEIASMFVLTQKTGVIQIIPKRDLTSDSIAGIRKLIGGRSEVRSRLQENSA